SKKTPAFPPLPSPRSSLPSPTFLALHLSLVTALHKVSELQPQFLRSAEKTVLNRLLAGLAKLANGAELETLVMIQFEDHAFARVQKLERCLDALPNFL